MRRRHSVHRHPPMPNLDAIEVTLRLAVAVLAGAVLGINRDLSHKPAGLRTHALVSLGSATACLVVLSTPGADANGVSRVVQGLVTGVGFIGAGVILHQDREHRVAGLTTAASIWLVAALGAACGIGSWVIVALALGLTLVVLAFGGPIERAFERKLRVKRKHTSPGPTG
jgi:putative Mg2+ transporter-C (MgtC) family protein